MEVILKENFPALGYVGDRVAVKRGYARNYLIPHGIAVEAGSARARQLRHMVDGINARKARLKVKAEELAQALSQARLEFTLKLGRDGKSFGSVSLKDIQQALKAQGFELDHRQFRLAEQIKSHGEFEVAVKLHAEVTVNLPVMVIPDRQPVKEAAAEEGAPAGGKRGRRARSKDAADETPAETGEASEPATRDGPEGGSEA